MNNQPLVSVKNVSKIFQTSQGPVPILEAVSCDIYAGEKVAIIGPSGSGKSTLLSLMGLLDTPTEGNILIDGQDTKSLKESEQARLRNQKIGFIFQSFELIAPFTVTENIAAPLEIGGLKLEAEALQKMLTALRLTERKDALPNTLSGGEKQRVAIARSLMHNPALLLADEPTGSLDRHTGERVLNLLLEAVKERSTTLVIITHDETIAAKMDRVFEIRDQKLHERS